MNSMMRMYVNTSRGNHAALRNELFGLGLIPKFDEYLHAFYMDGTMRSMFDISFRSRVAESLLVQIGQPFSAVSERGIAEELELIQFKNYLPLNRGLVEALSLRLLVRESDQAPSDNVLTVLLKEALDRQVVRKEYYQGILGKTLKRDRSLSLYEIRDIVQRKWAQEDLQLQLPSTALIKVDQSVQIDRQILFQSNKTPVQSNQGVFSALSYEPHLTLYVRKNKARILLRANQGEMYRHGWKKEVGWGPMRESLAATVLQKTGLL